MFRSYQILNGSNGKLKNLMYCISASKHHDVSIQAGNNMKAWYQNISMRYFENKMAAEKQNYSSLAESLKLLRMTEIQILPVAN